MASTMTKGSIHTIITATTLASTSSAFYIAQGDVATLGIEPDVAAGETADVQVSVDGTTYKDYLDGTSTVQLSTAQNAVQLQGPGWYKVQKTATATSTCGVYLSR